MSIAFRQAPFKTAGGTTARSLDAWFSDVVNVKEMGATGNGATDDAAAIQAAFDLAFGSPPNGWDNRHLNRPVFFPAGRYNVESTLTLTKVVGGHIYGAGKHSTHIVNPIPGEGSSLEALLYMNGCADLCVEKLTMEHINSHLGDDNTCVVHLDWDGDDSGNGCDGNHDNHFQDVTFGTGQYSVVIGSDLDSEGHNNLFINCVVGGDAVRTDVGYDVRGPNADNNQITGGGGISCAVAFARCPPGGGSIHGQGLSLGGGDTGVEFIMESDKVMNIGQLRTENTKLLRMENGIVIVQSAMGTGGLGASAIEVNGGKCILQGCDFHPIAEVIGTGGELYLLGNFWEATTPLSGYSGTVVVNEDGIT